MRITSVFCGSMAENAYLAGADDTNECVVVDPGEAGPVLDRLQREGRVCTHILITHGHFDHIGGAAALKRETGAKLCIHEADADKLASNRLSLAYLFARQLEAATADMLLHDGDELDVAGLHIRVLHTPGHSEGGACYLIEDEKAIFCGDTLFYESVGRTDFPGCSQEALQASIREKLLSLDGDYTLYCGHGMKTTLLHERACNPFIGEASGLIW